LEEHISDGGGDDALLQTAADDALSLDWPHFDSTKKGLSYFACMFLHHVWKFFLLRKFNIWMYLMHAFLDLFITDLIEYISWMSLY